MRAPRPHRLRVAVVVAVLALVAPVVVATTSAAAAPAPDRVATGVELPPVNGRFDYQIGGAYAPATSVRTVIRDRGEKPVRGRYNVCYVNAFQTQPDEAAFWKREHPTLLLRKTGKLVTDPDWPGEYLLDTSTAARRKAIAGVVGRWIDGCATAGFQAVEPDNLDSWTRSKGRLSKADNVALAKLLAVRAHAKTLAIAQKNAAELGTAGRRAGFDFAIAEECEVYRECGAYTKVYGRHVLEIEYTDTPATAYRRACAARGSTMPIILRDRDVLPRGKKGYTYRSC